MPTGEPSRYVPPSRYDYCCCACRASIHHDDDLRPRRQDIDDFLADNPQPPPAAAAAAVDAAAADADNVNTTGDPPAAAAADPPISPRPDTSAAEAEAGDGEAEWGLQPPAKAKAGAAWTDPKNWQSQQTGMSMAARVTMKGEGPRPVVALSPEQVRNKVGFVPPPPPPPPPPLKRARVNLFELLESRVAPQLEAQHATAPEAYDAWDRVVHANLRMLWAAHDVNRDGALAPAELRVFVAEMVAAQNRLVALRMAARAPAGAHVDVEKVIAAAVAEFDASGAADAVVEEIMAAADADQDGRLSLPEMKEYFAAPPPPPPPPPVRKAHADLFARFARALAQKGEKCHEGLFAMDRGWTEALNANVVAIWANYDTDKDGFLDAGELRALLGEMLRAQEKMFYARLAAAAEAAEDGDARAGTHMTAFAAAVDAMGADGALDRLLDDALAQADTDGDGKARTRIYCFTCRQPSSIRDTRKCVWGY